ncbi:MAG: hypothetical protein HOJ79_13860 [Nitrospina sp.]|jgi:hypothetical protein|nr:hypothetical protein [Nitrospina sp.]
MLIFKNNIYEINNSSNPENEVQQKLDPYDFILRSLTTDREIFHGLQQLPQQESQDHLKTLFPHASRFGSVSLMNTFSRLLLEGLVNRNQWHSMNAYHMTYLFDSLHGTYEEYSYLEPRERKEMFPELKGDIIDFDHFLENYFFGTAFLMNAERYNNMSPEEKKRLKLTDPCLFGVVNRLIPDDEETRFKINPETPYSSK